MTPTTVTPEAAPLAPPIVPITFYSASGGLIVNINNGRRVIEPGGTTAMVDQKVAEFYPMGDGYGRLITSDPEIIAKLTARSADKGDVFTAQEYLRRSTPAETRLENLQRDHQRLLEDHNRLLAKIDPEGKLLPPGITNRPVPPPRK